MEDIKVTIVQSELVWENIDANLNMFSNKLKGVAPDSTDLIVLPEMFSTGFSMNASGLAEDMNGKAVSWMRKMATEKKCVITGSLIIKEDGHFYNRLVWMKPDGTNEKYDKRHLFRMGTENNTYTAGNKKIIVDLKGWKICPLVCYDLRFPVWSRQSSSENLYDCLVYVANWPEVRSYPWKQLLIARAIENQCYVIGVNRVGEDGNDMEHSGDSAVINAKGQIISKTKTVEESIETVVLSYKELEDFRKVFPVAMDADKFRIEGI
jgi:predicted amidohydrolase